MPQDFSTCDLWERLAAEKRDILLYGMGNGADKILDALTARGIRAMGVFASDGFARGQTFRGFPVRSYSEIARVYPPQSCVVLLAFGTARPEVRALIEEVGARYELFVPDVPVAREAGPLFDNALLAAHREDLARARALFADEASRELFDTLIEAKRTGSFPLLTRAVTSPERTRGLLRPETIRVMADLGAFTGDTVRETAAFAPLSLAIAAEPDPHSYKKLCAYGKTAAFPVECHRAAISDASGTVFFAARGNRGAGLAENGEPTPALTVDALLDGRAVDYLKYDVEGAEHAALVGSSHTLRTFLPRLRVACYHRSEDLYDLPLLLCGIEPRYQLYLARADSLPAWDIDLIAIPR